MDQNFLNNPSFLELDDAYRGLSNHSILHVKTAAIERTIRDIEKLGFVAIQVLSFKPGNNSFMISASKGKHGPCIYNGKNVKYIGKALAALDDDNHIFIRGASKLVCDKTSRILEMDVYHELISSAVDEDNQIKKDGADDLETNLENLYNQLKSISRDLANRQKLFYLGPFRLLILMDGTIIHRAKWTSVPKEIANDLIKNEGFRDWENPNVESPLFFQEEYIKKGSGCLMENIKPKPVAIGSHETDFSGLESISRNLKERLINLIKKERKYFVLIGNEADDTLGCCPSEEVSEANLLVRSGILDALSEPVSGDACPVTLYVFKDEVSSNESGFSSKINKKIRDEVYKRLTKSTKPIFQLILKWILLAFLAISTIFAVRQCNQTQRNTTQKSLSEVLIPSENPHVQVILFHNKKRCFQCERMEKFTKQVLQNSLTNEVETGQLRFSTIIIDDPENSAIVEQYGIFASTLVLVSFEDKVIIDSKVLLEATNLYRDEKAFKTHVESELQKFLAKENE